MSKQSAKTAALVARDRELDAARIVDEDEATDALRAFVLFTETLGPVLQGLGILVPSASTRLPKDDEFVDLGWAYSLACCGLGVKNQLKPSPKKKRGKR